jgi:chromosome segregation ATPase
LKVPGPGKTKIGKAAPAKKPPLKSTQIAQHSTFVSKDELRASVEKLKTANARLRRALKERQKDIVTLQDRVTELEHDLEAAERVDENESDALSRLRARLRAAEIRKDALATEVRDLKAGLGPRVDHDADRDDQDQLERCKEAVKRYRAENERLTAEITRLIQR